MPLPSSLPAGAPQAGVFLVPDLLSATGSLCCWCFQYVKHCAADLAKLKWRVLVLNHRGLGGVQITVRPRSSGWGCSCQQGCFADVLYAVAGWPVGAAWSLALFPVAPVYTCPWADEGGVLWLCDCSHLCCDWPSVACTLQSKKLYNAGWTEDLQFVLELLKEAEPGVAIYACGTSMGGNILVRRPPEGLATLQRSVGRAHHDPCRARPFRAAGQHFV